MNNPFIALGDFLGYLHDQIKAATGAGDGPVRAMARRPGKPDDVPTPPSTGRPSRPDDDGRTFKSI